MNLAEDTLNNNLVIHRVNASHAYFSDIADMHIGNMLSNKEKLQKVINKISSTPNFYVMIGGDSQDNSSTKSQSSVFSEDIHGGDQVLACKELLLPIKDRILCVRSGNHGKGRAMKHNNLIPEQILAEFLGVPYLEGCASVFLNVNKNLYVIASWHNSKKPDKMEWLQSDVTFYEHLHKTDIQRSVVAVPNRYNKIWTLKEHYDIQAGSFLSWGGYAAEKGYRPLPTGCPVIKLSGTDTRKITAFYDISELT